MHVNNIQIGGSHYRKGYQHWDFVVDTQMPYLLGCATKYVSRWREKNGAEDLMKANHYLMKVQQRGIVMGLHDKVHVYAFASQFYQQENKIIKLICDNNFNLAVELIDKMIIEFQSEATKNYVDPDHNYIKG